MEYVGGAGGGSGFPDGSTTAGSGSTPANIYDIDYRAPAGQGAVAGGNGASGGLVVISW
jgi:hypothetical protein